MPDNLMHPIRKENIFSPFDQYINQTCFISRSGDSKLHVFENDQLKFTIHGEHTIIDLIYVIAKNHGILRCLYPFEEKRPFNAMRIYGHITKEDDELTEIVGDLVTDDDNNES